MLVTQCYSKIKSFRLRPWWKKPVRKLWRDLSLKKKDVWVFLGFFRQPRTLRILEQKTNSTFKNWVVHQKQKERGWDHKKEFKSVVWQKILLWIAMKGVKISIIQPSLGYKNSNERLKLIVLILNLPQKAGIVWLQPCWKIQLFRNGRKNDFQSLLSDFFWIFLDEQDERAWSKFYYIKTTSLDTENVKESYWSKNSNQLS